MKTASILKAAPFVLMAIASFTIALSSGTAAKATAIALNIMAIIVAIATERRWNN